DLMVHAAGVEFFHLVPGTGDEELRPLLGLHLASAFFDAPQGRPPMSRPGWGSLVMVVSVGGEMGAAGGVADSAAIAGLTGLTKALGKETARAGITVNAVAPGVIDTGMNGGFSPEEREALLARIPLGRFGSGDDVAKAVAFLGSDEASYVTGHVLWVTGGFDPLP